MIRVRKSLLYFITFLVFLFAIVAGLQRIGALDRHSPGKSVDFSSVQNIFDNAKNSTKAELHFTVSDVDGLRKAVSNTVLKQDGTIEYSASAANYYSAILTFDNENLDAVMTQFRGLKGLDSEQVSTETPLKGNINVTAHLANKNLVKSRLEKDLKSASRLSDQMIASLSARLSRVQSEIDSLNSAVASGEYNTNTAMLMLTAVHPDINGGQKMLPQIKRFSETMLATLLTEIVILLLFYLVLLLFLKLAPWLGIKPIQSSSSNYNYHYNRTPAKKKIKRVYKDADGERIEK